MGLTQKKLAENLGIKTYKLSFIENKLLYPAPELAEKIAKCLDVSMDSLWSKEELDFILYKGGEK